MENLGKAEDNAVALDRLKRTLGDVNVSFGALKAAVDGTAESSRITYAEAGKLGTQYARAGNLSGGELGEECLSQTSLPADAAFVRTGMFSSGPGAVAELVEQPSYKKKAAPLLRVGGLQGVAATSAIRALL